MKNPFTLLNDADKITVAQMINLDKLNTRRGDKTIELQHDILSPNVTTQQLNDHALQRIAKRYTQTPRTAKEKNTPIIDFEL